MSNSEYSSNSQPLLAYLREQREGLRGFSGNLEAVLTVSDYVDVAKRILLQHRIRDFLAADVVALAAIMEARDRAMRIRSVQE